MWKNSEEIISLISDCSSDEEESVIFVPEKPSSSPEKMSTSNKGNKEVSETEHIDLSPGISQLNLLTNYQQTSLFSI